MTSASPLELLHPSGRVERVLVAGESCPPALIPPEAAHEGATVDLVLIAPSRAELGRRGWLERATRDAAARLAEDGVAYALLPRTTRFAAWRRLREAGLVVEGCIAHLPSTGSPRYLLPLEARAWRHAMAHVISSRPQARRALAAMRAMPAGEAVLAAALPSVALVARHPGAPRLAAWIAALGDQARPVTQTVVASSWRGGGGPAVMLCFAGGEDRPWGIAKVAPGGSDEAELIEQLGDRARAAGARVPRVLASRSGDGRAALLETVLDGRPAAELLARSPNRFAAVAETITDWQVRWNRETAMAGERFHDELLVPARELGDVLPDGYSGWLAQRCADRAGAEPPLVARHNDLTMWNVLLDAAGTIGVLDWAEAEATGLPLTDFFYSVADAAAACDGYRDRLAAVRDCFGDEGSRADTVARLQERLRMGLRLGPESVELSFHACWLQHARNEQRRAVASGGEFLAIARWAALRALGEPT